MKMFPEIRFHENADGVPVMECYTLPQDVVLISDAERFIDQLTQHCSMGEYNGIRIPDFSKTLPIFIKSMKLTGEGSKRMEIFYRVNYTSISKASLRKATEYIAEGKLYAAMSANESNP